MRRERCSKQDAPTAATCGCFANMIGKPWASTSAATRLPTARRTSPAWPRRKSAYRFVQHDLSQGLPENLEGLFDCVLFPSSLYYIPRSSAIRVLRDARKLARPGAAFYLRMRTLRDYRFGRGEPVETNGFRLTTEVTGERGVLNVFYDEYELVDMLRDHLGAEADQMRFLQVDYQNVQNDVVVSNADVIIWGRLPG